MTCDLYIEFVNAFRFIYCNNRGVVEEFVLGTFAHGALLDIHVGVNHIVEAFRVIKMSTT